MPDIPPLITSPATEPAIPIKLEERIELLDVLRGFALFGILLVNIGSFSWSLHFVSLGHRAGEGPINLGAEWLVRFLAEGKFYPLFSLLFGAGIAIQILRAEMQGRAFISLHLRRMGMLLFIGIIHAFFIWEGDILMFYAMMGLILPAFRNCKPRTLLVWMICCLVVPLLIYLALGAGVFLLNSNPKAAAEIDSLVTQWDKSAHQAAKRDLEVFAHGTFSEIMAQRAKNVVYLYTASIALVPVVLMMFLMGLYAGKRGLLLHPGAHLALFRRVFWCGLLVGLPGNLLLVISHELSVESWVWWFGSALLYSVAGPALMLAYVSAIILLYERVHWRRRFAVLAPVGRMALTNYLLQSLICTTFFYSYGLGRYGKIGNAGALIVAVLVFLVQIPLSHWWLRRFQFGPVEWLWRAATYRRFQPMRRSD